MCLPSAPSYSPPAALTEKDKPQEVKQPQTAYGATATARKDMNKRGGGTASTLLTGPSGIETSQLALGKTTLLGQ
jgi:hypothetical protein